MALTVGDRPVRPLTADEVLRMVELGILSEDEPVELLHGALTRKAVKTPQHEAVKARLVGWLAQGAGSGGYEIRVEACLVVPDHTSLPEPDLMAVAGGGDPLRHPATALLVVEVSWSSLRVDIGVKPALYAAAGVPELWVVDVPAGRVLVLTEPGETGYAQEHVVGSGEHLRPHALEIAPLAVDALFAGL
jgi:Uma2 family endonuclease